MKPHLARVQEHPYNADNESSYSQKNTLDKPVTTGTGGNSPDHLAGIHSSRGWKTKPALPVMQSATRSRAIRSILPDAYLPLCARCTGMYLGTLVTLSLLQKRKRAAGTPAKALQGVLIIFLPGIHCGRSKLHLESLPGNSATLPTKQPAASHNWFYDGHGHRQPVDGAVASDLVEANVSSASPFRMETFYSFAGSQCAGWSNCLVAAAILVLPDCHSIDGYDFHFTGHDLLPDLDYYI